MINACSICKGDIECLLSFPELPLTGIFIEKDIIDDYPKFNQELMLCPKCGHAQLKNMIDSKYLYQDTYTHRSGQSKISKNGNDFFVNYLFKLYEDTTVNAIFEIGCNDLYLLSKLEDFSDELVGVDPIWDDGVTHKGNIKVLGGFAENVNFEKVFINKPELIISSHTFEHIQDIQSVLKSVLQSVDDGTKYLIEIPCFDTLLKTCRFDQIFHQHFNYFSLHSFFNLVQLHNCEFLEYTMNYDYWGGTMLIYFQKGGNSSKQNPFRKYTKEYILSRFQIFKNELRNIESIIDEIDEDIYGFGAAQMLPMLAYHMDSKLSFLKSVIDDNNDRCEKKLVGLDIPIVHSSSIKNMEKIVIMVTALDSAKEIINRLNEDFKPRYILKPIQIF